MGAEKRAAERGGFGHAAVIDIERHTRARSGGVFRIELSGGGERRGGGFGLTEAVQQMTAVEVVFRVIGHEREGGIDRRQ